MNLLHKENAKINAFKCYSPFCLQAIDKQYASLL